MIPQSNRLFRILSGLLVPALFFMCIVTFGHFGGAFEYDTDEGLCLARAFMHAEGYSLYKDIWMDTPPFLILLLSGLIKIFGPSVYLARTLILVFSTLLLWALFQILSRTQGFLIAFLTTALIALSSFYVKLSVSIMIGLPAVALAILSSYGVFLYQEKYQKRYLLLSGCLLALALQSKLFVIIFIPALILEILVIEKDRSEKEKLAIRSLSTILFWFAALIAVYLSLAFIVTSIDFSQIIKPYSRMRSGGMFNDFRGLGHVTKWILEEYDVALLALGSLVFLKLKEKRFFIAPFTCFILGVSVFVTHSPMWYHHRLLVLVPMCWLASFGFHKLFSNKTWCAWQNKNKILKMKDILAILILSAALILTVARLPFKYKRLSRQIKASTTEQQRHVVDTMKRYRKETHLVVTDRPIFAFYADLPVHPYLATSSWKRMAAGLLTPDDFLNIIEEENPEMILFARFSRLRNKLGVHIEDAYELEYNDSSDSMRLYVSKRIKR